MTTEHEPHGFYAGDDWQINGTLRDANNIALDLTGAVIEWGLLDSTGTSVIASAQAQIAITDAAKGKIQITVPSTVTSPITAGDYSDACRITAPFTATMWVGPIIVKPAPLP